jgi:hypothetical protein
MYVLFEALITAKTRNVHIVVLITTLCSLASGHFYQTTRYFNQENHNMGIYYYENFRCCIWR